LKTVAGNQDWGYGVVLSVLQGEENGTRVYTLDTLLSCKNLPGGGLTPVPLDSQGAEMNVGHGHVARIYLFICGTAHFTFFIVDRSKQASPSAAT
jgi:hypothetical protein